MLSNYYITATEKSTTYPYKTSEIQAYCINTEKSSGGQKVSKDDFFNKVYNIQDTYYTYNPKTGDSAKCYKKVSSNNEPYLQSISNGEDSDNLHNLPDC